METVKSSFFSEVSGRRVTDAGRRGILARRIRSFRGKLRRVAGIPEDFSGKDWTEVQKEIHRRLDESNDSSVRREAEVWIERLLDAEEELIEGNLRLVLMVVRRYSAGDMGAMEEMDFVQEGCEGLLDAVRRFDFTSDRGFVSYAVIRIRRRVLLAMENQQRLVRIPSGAVKKTVYLKSVMESFAGKHGRYPRAWEIENETGMSIDWPLIMSITERVIPLHAGSSEPGITLEEKLPGDLPSPEDSSERCFLEEALEKLDKRSKLVLVMRYGLMDGDPRTLKNISNVLGISIERTRQIEKEALGVLRHSFCGFSVTDWLRE